MDKAKTSSVYNKYVRRRRNRKIVASVACICATGVAVLGIVALLSNDAGAYTVSLNRGTASLTMSGTEDFLSSTAYIAVNDIPPYHEYTYSAWNEDDGDFSLLDNENSQTPTPDVEGEGISYFKYTFFVKNTGASYAEFSLSLHLGVVGMSNNNAKDLNSVLRVMFYSNRDLTQHNRAVYALRSNSNTYQDEYGNEQYSPERIAGPSSEYATPFISASNVLTSEEVDFAPDEVIRYTFVFWIEGEDPDCVNDPPTNGLTLSVNIGAKEQADPEIES
ncbi:MAG: hypothetical protein WC201_02290 [Bacilli bacterium]